MSEITRTVTVFDQNTQEKTVLENVKANTFGELKTILRSKGINLDNMDVREGISRVDLKSDSAQLPHDTPYRGGTTNDLMILLTKTNKKVSSGLGRSEAVQYIKDNNLGAEVKAKYGKNWTNVGTADLVAFVEARKAGAGASAEESDGANKEANCPDSKLIPFLNRLVEILYDNDILDEDEYNELQGMLGRAKSAKKDDGKGFSQDEIWDALRSM